jgi:hypothetical protein
MTAPRTPTLLGAATLAALVTACNPLAAGKLVDGAHVRHFELSPPVSGKPWGPVALRVPSPDGADDGFLLMAGETVPVLTSVRLSVGGDAVAEYANTDQIQDLMFPLTELDDATIGGLAQVPSPNQDDEPHFVAGFASSEIGIDPRVVRFNSTFGRTDPTESDMSAPFIDGVQPNDFGKGLAAINLEPGGTAGDPDVEVAVGSDQGVLIFDSVGLNSPTYLDARAMIIVGNPGAFAGDNEPQGFHFTFCDNLAGFHDLTAGNLGPNGTPVFIASQENTLTLVADQGQTNMIGAPIYDCFAREIVVDVPSETYGAELFVTDFDGDGNDDLFVGDPMNNKIDVFVGTAMGMPSTPTFEMLAPAPDDAEFGFSINRADLTGGFGSAILVGAPGSAVGLDQNVGRVYVYRIDAANRVLEEPLSLEDQQPQAGSRHGIWVGGIYNAEAGREDIVVIGNLEGRIHLAVDETDPRP